MKIVFLVILLFSPLLPAEMQELAPGLNLDLDSHREVIQKDCSNTPGEICIWQCFTAINENLNLRYICNFEATGFFTEKITTPDGILFTGNNLIATDYRVIPVYPYQNAEICFNFGKETYRLPEYQPVVWVYKKSRIVSECGGRRETRDYD